MSQRDSGYARKERDLYETPYWVTEALLPHIRRPRLIWEPACGTGMMVDVLMSVATVVGSDIHYGQDFLAPLTQDIPDRADAIITNPPYNQAQEFIEMALEIMEPRGGYVSMLLRTDYDHAKTRAHLFRDCPAFSKKVVLTKRIVWFEGGKSPSFNHAWFIWDWQHEGPATIGYGP